MKIPKNTPMDILLKISDAGIVSMLTPSVKKKNKNPATPPISANITVRLR